jgi:quinol-cytochrome oxidoreductase complex cytochrome b subunit
MTGTANTGFMQNAGLMFLLILLSMFSAIYTGSYKNNSAPALPVSILGI